MVMRLIRQQDRERQGIGFDQIESPFFAEGMVKRAIQSYGDGILGYVIFCLPMDVRVVRYRNLSCAKCLLLWKTVIGFWSPMTPSAR